ncbi:MAG: hypothetical protein IKT55_02680 [Clostridia bacterium]|nr:hypothetical protein [Clostridia bacterium]
MPRCILLECNKQHGFLRMNHFIDEQLAPCVRSKILDKNTKVDELKEEYYTIKVVKDINESCVSCLSGECDNCSEIKNLYQDFGLPVKIKTVKSEIKAWEEKQLSLDPDSVFYYYKYFEAELFGKLIISDRYYCIEAIQQDDSSLIENAVFSKKGELFSQSMNYFSKTQTEDILSYAKVIENNMRLYLDFDYSVIMNFAFTKTPYFSSECFRNTNLLFYGLRTAYTKTDLNFYI